MNTMERNVAQTGREIAKVRSSKIRKIHGFTLVELIVVITILAILATVGFLALSGYTQDARDSAIKANVRSLQTAITSEAAVTNQSPRYYVVHDADYALSGAFAYVDSASVALTGWDVGQAPLDSNYTAGKPDFKKLKLNPEKFRISASGLPGGTFGVLARATGFGASGFGAETADASYDASSLMAAWADFVTTGANGKKRAVSYVQAAGISPASKVAVVTGNFPSTGMPAGNVSGLLRAEPGSSTNLTGALLDGGTGNGTNAGNQSVAAVDENISNVVALMHFDGRTENGDASRNSVVFNARMEGAEGSDTLVDDAGAAFVKTGTPAIATGTGKYGSSMYFNDSSYYTANTYNQDYSIAAGDFTVEAWIYNTIPASWQTNSYYTIAGTADWAFYMTTSSVLSWVSQSKGSLAWPTIPKNVWTHVAAVRSGTTVTIYVNGVSAASGTVSNGYTNATSFVIGSDPSGLAAREFRGYIDDLRITKGVARYSGTFTPEQVPVMSGSPLPIDQKGAAIAVVGNTKISNVQSKFWGWSAYFDGNGDYLSLAASSNFAFGTSDFTLEFWYMPTGRTDPYARLVHFGPTWSSNDAWAIVDRPAYATTKTVFRSYKLNWGGDGIGVDSTAAVSENVWKHVAVTRQWTAFRMFIDGELQGTYTSSLAIDSSSSNTLTIGWVMTEVSGENFTGYIDELRITKSVARYSATFSPQTSAFQNP